MGNHRRVAAIAQHRDYFQVRECALQFGMRGGQRQLVDFQQRDLAGSVPGALPAKFRTDGTTRPRDQHGAAAQPPADQLPVRGDRLAAKQIINGHFLQLARQ